MLTTALATVMLSFAVSAKDEKSGDDVFQFIFEATVEGMNADGMPRALAKKLAGNESDFVEKCVICSATRKALYHYANQTGASTGHGMTLVMFRGLDSTDNPTRRDAFSALIAGYTQDAFARKKMKPTDQAAMQRAIAVERERAMQMKPEHLENCPSCEGGSCQLPPDDNAGWGEPDEKGMVSRLSLVSRHPQVGRKLQLRLEVKNTGSAPAKFDDQQARVNGSLSIRGPQDVIVPYIATSFQTMGHAEQLPPNQVKIIFADLDAADQYLFEKAGEYVIQFVGRGGIPKSNELKVTLKDGKLSDIQAMAVALRKVAPQGWRVTTYMDSISIQNTPTNLKKDATSVTIFFTRKKEEDQPRGANQPPAKYLLATNIGHAWLQPQNEQTVLRWGDYEQVIGEAMKPFRKFEW